VLLHDDGPPRAARFSLVRQARLRIAQRPVLSKPLFHDTEAITSFRWNLDEVKALHSSLSASMRAECEYMAGVATPAGRDPQTRSGTLDRNAVLASEAY